MPETKRRGRPRSAQARQAILKAARDLLDEAGPARLTVEAVAARARVGKPTIYRYWANARELAMAALMDDGSKSGHASSHAPGTPSSERADFQGRLTVHLRHLIERFSSPRGRQTALMLATAERDSEMAKAFRNQVIMKAREDGRVILLEAIETGEIDPGTSIDVALDMIYGPIFFRLLTLHGPVTDHVADDIVTIISAALARAPITDKHTP